MPTYILLSTLTPEGDHGDDPSHRAVLAGRFCGQRRFPVRGMNAAVVAVE